MILTNMRFSSNVLKMSKAIKTVELQYISSKPKG